MMRISSLARLVSVSSKKARPAFRIAGSTEDRFSLLGWTQARRDRDAVVSSGAANFSDMGCAIAVQMMSGDFDDVETELGDFLDVFQAVGAPLLLPVRVINAEFQLRLHV